MQKLGKKQLKLQLKQPLAGLPAELAGHGLELSAGGRELTYTFRTHGAQSGIADILRQLDEHGIDFTDLQSSESSLEDIFVNLVSQRPPPDKTGARQ